MFEREITSEMRLYVRHGHEKDLKLNITEPVDLGFSEMMQLGPHVDLQQKMIEMRFDRLGTGYLTREAKKKDRPLTEAVYEWGRLHPNQIPLFFNVMKTDKEF